MHLSDVSDDGNLLLILTALSEHAKVKHSTRTIVELHDDERIINNIRYLFLELNYKTGEYLSVSIQMYSIAEVDKANKSRQLQFRLEY